MDLQTALIAGFSGIVGVGIGAYLTLKHQDQAERRLDQGAARVTYFELAENTGYLQTAIERGVTMPILTRTWPETRARLAALLPAGGFAVVATAYAKLTATEIAWGHLMAGSPQNQTSVQATADVLERVEAAATILELQGWPQKADRDALLEQLRENVGSQTPTPPTS